jgi:hypothetical protein
MIDNVVVPLASGYGLADEYKYLKSSIAQYLTGLYICFHTEIMFQNKISCHYDGRVTHRYPRFCTIVLFLLTGCIRISEFPFIH